MATTKTKRPKPQPKKPTQMMVDAIIASCDFPDCDHDFCAPDNLEPIKDYSIKITNSFGTMDGDYWEGIIMLNDQPIINAFNEGQGGPNLYHQMGDLPYDVVADYLKAAKEAFPRLRFEPEEALTFFLDVCYQNFNA